MVKIVPYLMLRNGMEAIEYYKNLFEAKLKSHQPFNEDVGKQFGFDDDTQLCTQSLTFRDQSYISLIIQTQKIPRI